MLRITGPGFAVELSEFARFFLSYVKKRIVGAGVGFEKTKDIFVAFLIIKRGKYSQSFLNTSFLLLISASFIGGPVIAENNPFLAEYIGQEDDVVENVYYTDVYEMPFKTTISEKPRDSIVEYTVREGDTLASIAEKFGIDVDTIKWENNLKSDIIKTENILRILPVSGVAHKVTSGESIYSIARKYKTDAQQIANFTFNDFTDIDTFGLSVGQTIFVPNGVIEQAKPKSPKIASPQIAQGAGTGRFIWPTTGSISQYPVWYHMAVDIANKTLPPVFAADSGTVSFASAQGYGYGNHIIIDHGNGFQTLYAHLSRIDVSTGQQVSKGQIIGRVGSTGRSTGPHLHFEVRSGGVLVNPLSYL